ncbi:uncharacterized protein [Parasteatoda tepidariorum]|uniref:uncharacterized protein n=1 Tax=Parasteatoda tepidariorum TaxID=114398 RepID=UPI001C72033B|nr:uncharacterized protein LOC122269366 [Parasteatoda tepidariorum]
MDRYRLEIFLVLFTMGAILSVCSGVGCYTCSVDFRSEKFSVNNSCVFPKDGNDFAHCSHNSKFCKAVVTRINGIFVMISRGCSDDCSEDCVEKGYGIRIRDCVICCEKEADCGTSDLYKKK